MGNVACSQSVVGTDAPGTIEAKQLTEEEKQHQAAHEARVKLYKEVAQQEPMWKLEALHHTKKVEEMAALAIAAAAAAAAEAAEKAAHEEAAAKEAAAVAAAADAGKGVWADEEKHKKEEEKHKKDEEEKKKEAAKKKKKVADESVPKKRKDKEPKKQEPPNEETLKKAIEEREKAWEAKPQQEKDDLSKKIILATKGGMISEVESLLQAGASVNAEDKDGWTPLIKAAEGGEKAMVEMLLKQGANAKAAVKLGSEKGQTALHFAAKQGKQEIAELLAPHSNLRAKNQLGRTPKWTASSEGHKGLAAWLRDLEQGAEKGAEPL